MSKRLTKYQKYLETSHWRELRKEAFKKYGEKCFCCESNYGIQVHHLIYRDFYSVTVNDLRPLCKTHHEKIHKILLKVRKMGKMNYLEKWNVCLSILNKEPLLIDYKYENIKVRKLTKLESIDKNFIDICKRYNWNITVPQEYKIKFVKSFLIHNRSAKRFAQCVEKYAISVESCPSHWEIE